MIVQDLLLEAFTIAVCLKALMSVEDFFMMHNWLSVKVENCIGPIRVNIRDADNNAVGLEFRTLSDYHRWIKNHITAANKIPSLTDESSSEDEQ